MESRRFDPADGWNREVLDLELDSDPEKMRMGDLRNKLSARGDAPWPWLPGSCQNLDFEKNLIATFWIWALQLHLFRSNRGFTMQEVYFPRLHIPRDSEEDQIAASSLSTPRRRKIFNSLEGKVTRNRREFTLANHVVPP